MPSPGFPELELSSKDRYNYFISKARQTQLVWFVDHNDQSVTLRDDANRSSIPVWPTKGLTEPFFEQEWKEYEIRSVELSDFLDWLSQLDMEDMYVTVFPNTAFDAYVVPAKKLKTDLVLQDD